MYAKYGNHQHEAGECEFIYGWSVAFGEDNTPTIETHRVELTGRLQAADGVSLTAAIAVLEAAYRIQGQDIGLYYDDGSIHQILRSADCFGGTRSLGIQYPSGRGPEGGTFRNYKIVVEGDRQIGNPGVTSRNESVSFSGGGPLIGWITCSTGPPYKDIVAEQTPFEAVQSGSATGFGSYPDPPGPLWPDSLDGIASPPTKSTSQNQGRTEYHISWNYRFKSATPLS
jgi:hypothetical protein